MVVELKGKISKLFVVLVTIIDTVSKKITTLIVAVPDKFWKAIDYKAALGLLPRALKDVRGISAVIGVIILLATLMIGAIVFAQLGYQAQQIAQSTNNTAALNFITNTLNTGWSALNLFIIAAIVMAAGFILALLVAWGRSGGEGV